MASEVKIRIRATDQTRGAIQSTKSNLKELENSARNTTTSITSAFGRVNRNILAVGAAAGTLILTFKSLADTVKSSVNVFKGFEAIQVRLENMFGSVSRGKQAFQAFNQIAATTPFMLEDVVEAGATLKAFMGDVFNKEYLKIAADLAAYMGVNIRDAAMAMGRAFAAGAGAADVLRERGILNLIKTKQQIDDFKNITLEEFREAMWKTFTDPSVGIVGATDKLAKTIVGLESNAQDAFTRLQAVIGERFAPQYKAALKSIISITNEAIEIFTNWSKRAEETAQQVIQSFKTIASAAEMQNIIKMLRDLQVQLWKSGDAEPVKRLADEFDFLTESERAALVQAGSLEEAIKALGDIANRIENDMENMNEQLKSIGASTEEVTPEMMEMITMIRKMKESMEQLPDKVETKFDIQIDESARRQIGIEPPTIPVQFDVESAARMMAERIQTLEELRQLEIQAQVIGAPVPDFIEQVKQYWEEQQQQELMKIYFVGDIDFDRTAEQLMAIGLEEELASRGIQLQLKLELEPVLAEDAEETITELQRQLDEAMMQERIANAERQAQADLEMWNELFATRYDIQLKWLDEMWKATSADFKRNLKNQKAYERARTQLTYQAEWYRAQASYEAMSTIVGGLAELLQASEEVTGQQFGITKAVVAAQAMIDAFGAANRALNSLPYPANIAAATVTLAAAMMNVARITSMDIQKTSGTGGIFQRGRAPSISPPPSFQEGGIIPDIPVEIPAAQTITTDTVPIMATPGEAVIPRHATQRNREVVEALITGETTETTPTQLNVEVTFNVNAIDAHSVEDFVSSHEFRSAFADIVRDGLLMLKQSTGEPIGEVEI